MIRSNTHNAEILDGVHVRFVFLHFLPVTDHLLHLLRVDVFRPSALRVVDAASICLKSFSVHLVEGCK